MQNFGAEREDAGGTVFRDVILLALIGMIASVIILIPFINPPTEQDYLHPPGNVIVYAEWPPCPDPHPMVCPDVDLWVLGPADRPVGYSNSHSGLFDLLRDDLGRNNDLLPDNFEYAYGRGILEGEYVVNLHLYREGAGWPNVPVHIAVSVKATKDGPVKKLHETDVVLERHGHEVTAVRFRLDRHGNLVPGSVHAAFMPLRSYKR